MVLVDLRNKGITGKAAEKALVIADITVNKNMVPFDDKSPFVTSGIRLGSPALTTRGLKEEDMVKVVDLIDRALMQIEDESALQSIGKEVQAMMSHRPLFMSKPSS
jgi:glycine hydroxymethyltransferase